MLYDCTQQPSINEILDRIAQADSDEISQILFAIVKRHARLHPDTELLVFSLPKQDDLERLRQINRIFAFLRGHQS